MECFEWRTNSPQELITEQNWAAFDVIRLCPSLKQNLDWKSPEVWVFVWWESQFMVEPKSHEFKRVHKVVAVMHCCYDLYAQTVFEAITRVNFCSLTNDGLEVIVLSATQFSFNQIYLQHSIFLLSLEMVSISWLQILFFTILMRPWKFLVSYWTNEYLKKWYDVYP